METSLRTMAHEIQGAQNNGPDAIMLGRSAQGLGQPGERVHIELGATVLRCFFFVVGRLCHPV